ncbi:GMC oxidoreductase [Aplosporella prunicola CBS 121167]|uniref:GMC oxidoreductase n=1 Tax=Aplosporella prunicola CBS 121167 TaxID=1176127 RepID=A0A6A6B184_9PEZI|nr:GMC oxidoreductase [Aplosporella prunicola CBS 121167]KAF2137790.1 GMC oxidoreductase [Aplosporella prunicola CBS 121167]
MYTRFLSTIPLLAASALAAPHTHQANRFDYVIVGGGTSGLVVANRLSELKNASVAIIEAGGSVFDNTNVTSTSGYGLAFGTDIDWAFQSEPQEYAGNKPQTLRAGKALGGTSAINGMAYTRAEDAQIDVWEKLGNKGWNWESLFPYYKKHEALQVPTEAQFASGATYDKADHGFDGPLKIGWTHEMSNITAPAILNETFHNLGVPYSSEINGGQMRGFTLFPKTVDPELGIREDAARAFYFPYQNRTNLALYSNTEAQKLVWTEGKGDAVANGVEVIGADGKKQTIYANKEVILSAGALTSPVLLEKSGVGNPKILKKAGIDVKVNLPAVGENLQDQTNAGMMASSTSSWAGQYGYVAYPNAQDIFGNQTATIQAHVKSSLKDWARQAAAVSKGVIPVASVEKFFQLQYDLIFTQKIPIAEVLVSPTGEAVDAEFWGLLPFARGSIHVNADAEQGFTADPKYYMFDWDRTQHVGVAKYIRTILNTAPFNQYVAEETTPGVKAVPAGASDEDWFGWVKENYRSNFHPVGSTAMMPKDMGGVVDAELRVYGTKNVRVVDAGVLPFQVCGHLVSTLYAVAERASDLIKKDA